MTHNILYIMGLTRAGDGTQLPDRKIGITGSGEATLRSRTLSFNGTKSPFLVEPLAAWTIDDARGVESVLHALLQPLQTQGEWFIDKDDYLVEAIGVFMDREPTATRIPIDTRDDPVLNRAQKIRDTEYSNRTNELHNLLMQSLPNVTVGTPFADGFMPILTKGAKIWTRVLQQGFSLLIHPESTDIPLDYDHYHRVLDELGLSYHHRQSKNGEFIRTQCGDSETLVKSLKVLTKEI